MQTMWSLYGMISLIFLAGVVGYGAMILVTNPHAKEISAVSSIKAALRHLGMEKPAWCTLIVSASQDLNLPVDQLWETWSRLENWSEWSKGAYLSTRWKGESGWNAGARFEQVVDLGFPAGKHRSVETVEEVEPMRRVRWCNHRAGVRSCHVWSFTMLPNGRVRVTNTEVFHGAMIGLMKPIVVGQWEKKFNAAVTGLAQAVKRA